MRNKFIIIAVISFLFSKVYSQENIQNINIWYFSPLVDQHKELIINLKMLLGKKADNKYLINIVNIYTKEKVIIRNIKDTFYLAKDIQNVQEIKENEFINNIEKRSSKCLIFNEDKLMNIGTSSNITSINEIAKIIKKHKKSDIDLIWYNSFVPAKNSMEYLNNLFAIRRKNNDYSDLITKIYKPYDREQLRPNGKNYYKLEFKKIEYFNTYEVYIFMKDENHVIFREKISLTNDENLNSNFFMKIEGENCIVYLKEDILSTECYKKKYNVITEADIKNACGECKDECLYFNNFMLKIRGVKDSFYKEELWSDTIQFQFQCNRQ